jgi:FAD synthase
MIILDWPDFLDSPWEGKALAATVGVFDGVHLGHRTLIDRVVARSRDMRPTVFTFRESPKRFLHPKTFRGDLYSLDDKIRLIAETGVELCVLIDFSSDFGKLSGSEFLSSLRNSGDLRFIAVGSDFRFGYKLDIDAAALATLCVASGIEAEIMGPVNWNGKPISSSRIRKSIIDGKVLEASSMLGRLYGIDLIGNPSTRLATGLFSFHAPAWGIVPSAGRYFVETEHDGSRRPGIVEVGADRWIVESDRDAEPTALYFKDAASRE